MREIKFRVWKDISGINEDTSEFETSGFMFEPKDSFVYELNNTNSRWTVMQYTGLKDKNGKEIYEGDVVEYLERGMKNCIGIGQVTWDKDGWNVEGFYDGSQDEPGRAFSENAQLEIIGNIYEHSDLLK